MCPRKVVSLTAADAGRTISVLAGTEIDVHLAGSTGFPWSPVHSSNHAAVIKTSGSRVAGSSDAHFSAIAAGTSQLTASQVPACTTAPLPCALPARLWSVTVKVVSFPLPL
jgi:hypothetical protein